jgi:predicted O-linked N-acetylglucosamine transferase (SPINDLY family)
MVTIPDALTVAIQHHQAGQLQAAERIYRQILAVEPNHAAVIHLLGVIAHQLGKHAIAVEYIGRAIGLNPNVATYHNNLGNALQDQGKPDEAVACYRRALELKPDDAEAHNNLGVVLRDQGKLDEAAECYHRALALKPDFAEAYSNLGVVFKNQKKLDEAVACYRRALALKPDFAKAHNNLGNTLKDQGKLDEATACYRRAVALKPGYVEAHGNLAIVFAEQGKLQEAVDCWRRVVALKPDDAEVHNNLGIVFKDQGKPDEAVACYRRALALKPDFAKARNNLGIALKDLGKLREAVACYRRILELNPDDAEAHNNLGVALKDQGKLDEAVACWQRALELKPDFAKAHNNLGVAFKDQGKLDEAVACYHRALELKPDFAKAHSNLLYTRIFCPGADAATLYEEHRRWNQRHATPLAEFIRPHLNDRSPDRRLRIGYVSPDFRNHCQAFFTVPLFSAHDHEGFEIVCYADAVCGDSVTERLRCHVDAWRDIAGEDHEQVAQRIRRDGIDILVDLTMHMARNRLLVFARKPAPVQACWLAYPGTTGLTAIDYRITDPYLDPPGQFDPYYSEESIRLPDSFWCYDPLGSEPAVNALPAAEKGYISFGCLNNFCKVNPVVLTLWARVLKAVNRSRLTILAGEGTHRRHALELLSAEGVAHDRVTFVASRPRPQYLRYYHDIDIGLDTIPYNGHTTSLDSFWMGVPVVTLVGPTVVGRAGLCQLMNLGLPELIAASAEQYVRVAAELAEDLSRLSKLRATLRERMQASPLMDAPRFARHIEAAYRVMWRRWCAG